MASYDDYINDIFRKIEDNRSAKRTENIKNADAIAAGSTKANKNVGSLMPYHASYSAARTSLAISQIQATKKNDLTRIRMAYADLVANTNNMYGEANVSGITVGARQTALSSQEARDRRQVKKAARNEIFGQIARGIASVAWAAI